MLTIFSRIRTSKGRRTWIRLALAGFLVRALIPVGFMPASLASGGPIAVCHGGTAGTFFHALAEKSRDNAIPGGETDHSATFHGAHSEPAPDTDEPTREHSAWDNCPTGATASAAALAPYFSFSLLALSHAQTVREPYSGIPAAPVTSYQARAPPLNLAQLL